MTDHEPTIDSSLVPPDTGGEYSELLRGIAGHDIGESAVRATMSEIGRNWQYNNAHQLEESAMGQVAYGNEAQRPGLEPDSELAYVAASAVDGLRDAAVLAQATGRERAALDRINGLIEANGSAPGPEAAKVQILANMKSQVQPETFQRHPDVTAALHHELAERDKGTLEQQIDERIEADRLPWTMPNPQLPQETIANLKSLYESIAEQGIEPLPSDEFRVAMPMKHFEGGAYAPRDMELIAKMGDGDKDSLMYTREGLQRAGVFFVNRVGGGEQPLFGVPIPDPSSEDGVFNVQDRSFLTREEFEKVYNYQQEQGYGIGGRTVADVQLDMIVFATTLGTRGHNVRKLGGAGGRENKYGQTRSPFVDQGFLIKRGVETYVNDENGSQRMNTMTVHLANGHPDYPGVSEMFDKNQVAHDQKYMSAGEFVETYYQSPTTDQEALRAIKDEQPTPRERIWVGAQ